MSNTHILVPIDYYEELKKNIQFSDIYEDLQECPKVDLSEEGIKARAIECETSFANDGHNDTFVHGVRTGYIMGSQAIKTTKP